MAIRTINSTVYGEVLATVLPRVIKTKTEHARVLAEIEKLMSKPRLLVRSVNCSNFSWS